MSSYTNVNVFMPSQQIQTYYMHMALLRCYAILPWFIMKYIANPFTAMPSDSQQDYLLAANILCLHASNTKYTSNILSLPIFNNNILKRFRNLSSSDSTNLDGKASYIKNPFKEINSFANEWSREFTFL